MAPTLTTLPVEIFETIAELVPCTQKSLRLVSQAAAVKTMRPFELSHIKPNFTHQAYLLSESSLRLAVEIAGNPDFGPVCEKLTFLTDDPYILDSKYFSPDRFSREGEEEEGEAASQELSLVQVSGILVKPRRKRGSEDRSHTKEKQEAASEVASAQVAWGRGIIEELLGRLFQNLGAHGKLEEVAISTLQETSRQPLLSWEKAYGSENPQCFLSHQHANKVFAAVMKALAENNTPLDRFKIDTKHFAMATSPDPMTEQVLNNFTQVIHNLTHLDLKMDDHAVSIANMTKLAKAIAASPNLSSLSIGCACTLFDTDVGLASDEENAMAAALFSEDQPHLEHLNISDGLVQLSPLVEFAKKHKTQRLRRLDLEYAWPEGSELEALEEEEAEKLPRKLIGLPGTDTVWVEGTPFGEFSLVYHPGDQQA